jgi:hypothetical protein
MEHLWESEARDALEVVGELLHTILDLFFGNVLADGCSLEDYEKICASEQFRQFLQGAAELQSVDISLLTEEAKAAFFINLWNVVIVHSYLVCGFPTSELDLKYILRSSYYRVGRTVFCLADIKHGVLRGFFLFRVVSMSFMLNHERRKSKTSFFFFFFLL